MENLFNEEQIYRVTFGMKYGINNSQKFIDKLRVKIKGNNCCIKLPVYAMMKEGKLIEIVSGIEIPLAKNREEPGFYAYQVNPLYTYEDFKILRENLLWISVSTMEYKKALGLTIYELEREMYTYRYTHFDDFGRLSQFNEERKNRHDKAFDENITTSYELIKKMNKK